MGTLVNTESNISKFWKNCTYDHIKLASLEFQWTNAISKTLWAKNELKRTMWNGKEMVKMYFEDLGLPATNIGRTFKTIHFKFLISECFYFKTPGKKYFRGPSWIRPKNYFSFKSWVLRYIYANFVFMQKVWRLKSIEKLKSTYL